MTILCVPAVVLACAAPTTGLKPTGLLVDGHHRRKIKTTSGTRGKVVAARAGISGMDGGRGGRATAGGVGMWALAASNLASLAYLLHQHYVNNRPRASDVGSVPRTGSDDANGDTPALLPPPPEPAIAPDAVINLELGDPTMYEAFWREAGERAEVVIPGWWGMSYFSDAGSLAVVSDAYEEVGGTQPRLFDFARRRMEERWRALRAAVAASGAFSLPEETTGYCTFTKQTVATYPAFAWLRCEKEGVEDCAEFLRGHKIVARGGEQFGGDARCVRVNMLDRDGVFDVLVQRISSIT